MWITYSATDMFESEAQNHVAVAAFFLMLVVKHLALAQAKIAGGDFEKAARHLALVTSA